MLLCPAMVLCPVPTLHTNVLCTVLLIRCNCIKSKKIYNQSQISLQMILVALSQTGANISLTVP